MEARTNGGKIKDEHVSRDSNCKGSLSMANSGEPNSGGSQFFINIADNSDFDWFSPPEESKHPVFGMVTEGLDVAIKIANSGMNGKPDPPVKMNAITISSMQAPASSA